MGLLVNGEWHDDWYDTKSSGGRFVRGESAFRNWVTPDGAPRTEWGWRLQGRTGPLPSVCRALVSVGSPHGHFPQTQTAGGRHLDFVRRARDGQSRMGLRYR